MEQFFLNYHSVIMLLLRALPVVILLTSITADKWNGVMLLLIVHHNKCFPSSQLFNGTWDYIALIIGSLKRGSSWWNENWLENEVFTVNLPDAILYTTNFMQWEATDLTTLATELQCTQHGTACKTNDTPLCWLFGVRMAVCESSLSVGDPLGSSMSSSQVAFYMIHIRNTKPDVLGAVYVKCWPGICKNMLSVYPYYVLVSDEGTAIIRPRRAGRAIATVTMQIELPSRMLYRSAWQIITDLSEECVTSIFRAEEYPTGLRFDIPDNNNLYMFKSAIPQSNKLR
jgi:hypothetical protein